MNVSVDLDVVAVVQCGWCGETVEEVDPDNIGVGSGGNVAGWHKVAGPCPKCDGVGKFEIGFTARGADL